MTEFLGIIPARYASSRFPGKSLASLGKKPMVQWVYESASRVFDHLIVATDDDRIYDAVEKFGGKAMMTSSDHRSGTDRCAEAHHHYEKKSGLKFNHVVNIQGDEPLLKAEQLQTLLDCILNDNAGIATLIRPLTDHGELGNPNVVKVVVDQSFRALYFSRAPIPYIRDAQSEEQQLHISFYTHIGLYAFRSNVLQQVVALTPTPLELAESLEQLRWMENGISIQTSVTRLPSFGVDTPEDLQRISDLI